MTSFNFSSEAGPTSTITSSFATSTEKITTLQTNVMNCSSTPLFTYYDGNFTGTTSPMTQPVNIVQIKFVKLTMNLVNQDSRVSTSSYAVSAGASIRNLKTNLGN